MLEERLSAGRWFCRGEQCQALRLLCDVSVCVDSLGVNCLALAFHYTKSVKHISVKLRCAACTVWYRDTGTSKPSGRRYQYRVYRPPRYRPAGA